MQLEEILRCLFICFGFFAIWALLLGKEKMIIFWGSLAVISVVLYVYFTHENHKAFAEYQENIQNITKAIIINEKINLPEGYQYFLKNGFVIVEFSTDKRKSTLEHILSSSMESNLCKNGWIEKNKIVCVLNL
ncbi:MAG: hypothetical protein QXG16_04755 [Candidatus Anstonellaceae archaeon]